MTKFLQGLWEASVSGSVMILAVLVLRLVLKKAPRRMVCFLWLLVGLRLVLPFTLESPVSLQPQLELAPVEQVLDTPLGGYIPQEETPEFLGVQTPEVHPEDAVITPTQMEEPAQLLQWGDVAAALWLAGIGLLVLASLVSYLRLRRLVRESCRTQDGCWECPGLDTAFVLGFFPARIYLPAGLSPGFRACILAHEKAHIARGDHWVKLIGYGILTMHWFNPLVWLAYSLLCRDMELACDERVVKTMDLQQRKVYSSALLACSGKNRLLTACPVAFGEVSVKQRILSVLNYRKPRFWMILAAVAVLIFVAVCFLTDPVEPEELQQNFVPPQTETTEPIETTAPETIPDGPIGQCIRAFEAIENAEEVYIRSYNLDDDTEGDFIYLRSPQGWLHQYWDGRNAPERTRLLRYGDEQYRYDRDRDESWMPVGDYHWSVEQNPRNYTVDLSWKLPFCYEWDGSDLELWDHRQENGLEIIQIFYPLYGDIYADAYDDMYADLYRDTYGDVYTLYFRDGELQYYDSGDNSGDPSSFTTRHEVVWTGDISITQTIAQMYQEAHSICGDGRTVEAKFNDAWAQFAAAEQLHLTERSAYYTGEILERETAAECWIDRENWLRSVLNPGDQTDHLWADGTYQRKTDGSWEGLHVGDVPQAAWYRDIWFGEIHYTTPEQTTADGLNYITLRVYTVPPVDLAELSIGLEWGEHDSYTLRVCFDDQGQIYSLVLSVERDTLRYVSTLTVQATDGETIHSTVEAAMKSAQRG